MRRAGCRGPHSLFLQHCVLCYSKASLPLHCITNADQFSRKTIKKTYQKKRVAVSIRLYLIWASIWSFLLLSHLIHNYQKNALIKTHDKKKSFFTFLLPLPPLPSFLLHQRRFTIYKPPNVGRFTFNLLRLSARPAPTTIAEFLFERVQGKAWRARRPEYGNPESIQLTWLAVLLHGEISTTTKKVFHACFCSKASVDWQHFSTSATTECDSTTTKTLYKNKEKNLMGSWRFHGNGV